ncbi:hypothetical protein FACS1894151_04620 [Spirochaetia bacterium]|nr:hypothetical protein FACS1894151_04620 [Spirochaetia bacterium]
MRSIMESVFDAAYLAAAAVLGILILVRSRGRRDFRLFGIMTLILAGGDSFHLVPRILSLNSSAPEAYTAALGWGTFVTSITMTVFYVLLYHFWRLYYKNPQPRGRYVTALVYVLAIVRIALCLFPQNAWSGAQGSVETAWLWGIYRNIPFAMLGALIIALFCNTARIAHDNFRWMWLAITLSFACYIPVILWVDFAPIVGMLMIPKTCMYVWMIVMGLKAAGSEPEKAGKTDGPVRA